MRRKFLRKIIPAICACMVIMNGITCYATTSGAEVSITKNYVIGKYTYGKAGQQLKIELYYYDKIKGASDSTATIHLKTNVVNGNVTSVSTSTSASTGRVFTKASAYGFVNGKLAGAANDVTP